MGVYGKVVSDMLRICEDCIHNKVCNEWAVTSGIPFVNSNTCENFMTADVAPRSEVARELKAFEGKVGRIYNHYVFEDTDYAEDDVAIEAVINALTEVLNDLSDLCQKYTEGEK